MDRAGKPPAETQMQRVRATVATKEIEMTIAVSFLLGIFVGVACVYAVLAIAMGGID
jgi:hypothetical protein